MSRRIQPVPSICPLRRLLALARPGRSIGVWVAASGRLPPPLVHRSARLLLSTDLAALLGRVERIAAWDGAGLRVLPIGARRTG